MWATLSSHLGDFIEENLWGVDEEYFKEKYGKDWEKKYESTRQNVRTLYGLLPASDADDFEIALASAPFVLGTGALINLYRATESGLPMSKLIGHTRKGKRVIQGGGEYPSGEYEKPLYTALSKAEPSSYPRDLSRGRELYKFEVEEESLRKHAMGFERFDKEAYSAYEGYGVYQPKFTDPFGRTITRRGPELHAVFEKGLPVSEIKTAGRWKNITFPENPDIYYKRTGKFLSPEVSGFEDLTKIIKEYYLSR
tara:strand:+ start:90 stop:848 length:759 start_codon:yes stop_codon:yes gene_type:complete